jgi:hypothetical protein
MSFTLFSEMLASLSASGGAHGGGQAAIQCLPATRVMRIIAGYPEVQEKVCLSRERENTLPLVSCGPSGIGGEYQVEVR